MSKRFDSTRWSVVLAARDGSSSGARQALAVLCEAYWQPLYAFVRHQGYGADDAHDLTQGYFARLLEKRYLDDVDPGRGRFRSFLLVSLRHYLSDERDRQRALKRGGGQVPLSLDAEEAERGYRLQPVEHLTPELVFERRWAQTVVERTLGRLRAEHLATGREAQLDSLVGFLVDADDVPYRQVATDLGLSEAAVKAAVHRLRKRFGRLLRDEVAETVAREDQVNEELRHLLAVLQGSPGGGEVG